MEKVKVKIANETEYVKVLAGHGEAGSILLPHTADKDAHLMLNAGKVNFFLEETAHLLQNGDLQLIPANTLHHIEVIETCQFFLVLPTGTKLRFVAS